MALLTSCAAGAASAASAATATRPETRSLGSTSHPRPGAVTEPARGIDEFPYLDRFQDLLQPDRPGHSATAGGAATQTSTNWAGYVAPNGTYTAVSANWTEPRVTCTSNGIVAFWVGLDGFGSQSVQQNGTAVDCSTGTPQHFAWWETYPANNIQQYDDPVSPGDRFASTVTSEPGGVYDMVLTDTTSGWTEHTRTQVSGARNASAEIVAEAVTTDNAISMLPDFRSVGFTGARIDGSTPQDAGAEPVDMTDGTGTVIATTQQADAAGDFSVRYR